MLLWGVLASLLLAAVPAHADPIITPILIGVGVSASVAPFVSAGITLVVSIGLSLISSALFKPSQPKPSDVQSTITQSDAPRFRSYGQVKVGGVLVWAATNSTNGSTGGNFDRVFAMGSGEIDSVVEHWIDDNQITIDGSGNVTTPKYINKGNPKVIVDFRTGTNAPAVYAAMNASYPDLWTADHLGKGIPSAHVRLWQAEAEFMTDLFPQLVATQYRQVQRGAKVRDISGGAFTAPIWSDNPALIIADYLTHPDGLNLDDSWILNAAADWETAKDICNEQIAVNAGGTENRYRIWNTYYFNERPADILARYLQACDGVIFQTQNRGLAIKVGKWETPTVTIDDDAVIAFTEVGRGRDILTTANMVRARFMSPDHDYQATDAQPWTDDADIAARGEFAIDLDLFSVPSHPQCRRLQKIAAHRANPDWVGTLTCNLRALTVMGERFITVQLTELGIFDTFEVLSTQMVIEGTIGKAIQVQVQSLSSAAYDWDAATEEGAPPGEPQTIVTDNTLPDPVGFAVSASGTTATLSWTAPSDPLIDTEARYKPTAATDWLTVPVADGSTSTSVSGLADGTEYEFQIRNRSNTTGRATDWTASITLTILVDSTAPGAVTGLSAWTYNTVTGMTDPSAQTVLLQWTMPNSQNVVGARVYRNNTNDFGTAILRSTVFGPANSSQSYTDDMTGGGLVYYWVVAINGSSVEGPETAASPLSVEMVQNGDFDTDTVWTKNGATSPWTIAGGKASKAAGDAGTLTQPCAFIAGRSYTVAWTMLDRTAGNAFPRFFGGTVVNGTVRAANGSYSETMTAVTGNATFGIAPSTTFVGSVDNISVKEVIP